MEKPISRKRIRGGVSCLSDLSRVVSLPSGLGFVRMTMVLWCLVTATHAPAEEVAFGYEDVVARARELAGHAFDAPPTISETLRQLSYDQFRDIRFRPEKALWRGPGMNFDIFLIHAGLFYAHPVTINILDASGIRPLPYSPDLFSFGANSFKAEDLKDTGYAGFIINYPLKRKDLQSQVAVFAGASYFRAIGRDHVYGLSARGLAIDTALPSGEEFPFFREFWLERPSPRAQSMTVYALLDSRRVSGAYRLEIHPGETTRIEVRATLFTREPIEELGIAPLTSMFHYGEELPRPKGYWRPEVHDSDGLLMENGTGEWIWRPVVNDKGLRVSSFLLKDPRGYGLLQRDREFDHYQDLEAHYGLRPGAWVVPDGSWGKGRVKLTEIPTDKETNDNIVAYWVPAEKPQPGAPIEAGYTIYWLSGDPPAHVSGRAVATRIGAGMGGRTLKFVVDFNGGELPDLAEGTPVKGVVTVGEGGKLREQQVIRNPFIGGWRLVFQVKLPKDKPLDLRAYLVRGEDVLTETWTYLLQP